MRHLYELVPPFLTEKKPILKCKQIFTQTKQIHKKKLHTTTTICKALLLRSCYNKCFQCTFTEENAHFLPNLHGFVLSKYFFFWTLDTRQVETFPHDITSISMY